MLARLYLGVLVSLLACSIIDDGAITSQAELQKLKLSGFTIHQKTKAGDKEITATVVSDSAVNITDTNTGAKINRMAIYKLPSLGNSKLKFRSGTTTDVDMSISYINSSKPYTVALYQKDSVVEIYRFRYDAAGKLNRIITVINPVDNKPAVTITTDSLIYSSPGDIEVVNRKSNDPSFEGTIDLQYPTSSGNFLSLTNFTYRGAQYQQQDNCKDSSSPTGCGTYTFRTGNGGGGNGQSQFRYAVGETFNALNLLQLEDRKYDNNGTCCRDYDTYYFHPLMLLRNQLSKGDYLFLIYMMDWWVPGAELSGQTVNYTSNDLVTINFNYGN